MKKIIALLLAMVMALGLLAGCSSLSEDETGEKNSSEDNKKRDNYVTIGVQQDPESMFPYLTGQTTRQVTHQNIYQSLYRKDANNNLQPCMAYDYKMVEDHVYDVYIYDYIYDWDGNNFTASDVLFCWKVYEESGRAGSVLKWIENIEAIGEYTVRFTLNDSETSMSMKNILSVNMFTEKAYKDHGEAEGFATDPVGTGRYKPVDWVEGSYIKFEKWDNYWQTDESVELADADLAYVDGFTLTVITELSQMAIALETGEIDATTFIDTADQVNFVNEDGTAKSGYKVIQFNENLIPVIWMNNSSNSKLSDVRIRQAICYAIDMEAICKALFGNNAYAVGTWGRSEAEYFDESWEDEPYYAYDVDKAKELLAEAGYPNGGFKLVTCGCPADYADDIFLYVQAYLSEVGIEVEINNYESALFLTYRDDTTGTAWDMTVSRSTCPTIPQFLNFLDVNNYSTGMNAFYFNDPKLQELYDAAAYASTYSEETVHELVEYCYDNCFGYPCWVQQSYAYAQDYISDFKLNEPKLPIPGSFIIEGT